MGYRYQVSLDDELFENLKKSTGIDNNKELLNEALLLMDWAVDEVEQGRSIGSIDDQRKEIKEVLLPALRAAKARATKPKEKIEA